MIIILIFANQKNNSYDLIPVIINRQIKIIYYKLMKAIINILDLAKIMINMVMCYYKVLKSIIID